MSTALDYKVSISSISQIDEQRRCIQALGYDIRDIVRGREPVFNAEYVMNEDGKERAMEDCRWQPRVCS